ncbi:MAG: RidA family protein [Thermotogaceae bacterium]|jgi:enamine deaminase RidA (YjgF/YER057c/UK114 family)|nr:RidA family protein [Mesotoga sp.]MDI9374280.1 RidA family protein [Thermotogota bacterium]NLX34699.1 RidA family protein [Thermotogaceae bacterium]MDD4478009.1 RidA family protein [Mesotoga sp.]HOY26194.1 RidA family protein [Mesotoga sp.]
MFIEKRIEELGIELPPSPLPGAMYVPVKRLGKALYISGQVPMKDGKPIYTGKVGSERSIEYAQEAARLCVINMLAAVREYLGDLDRVADIVKLQAFVNSETGFTNQHIVANAASQLLYDIFGEAGRHTRTAVGTNQLPMDFTVEIEAIIEIRESGEWDTISKH